MNNENSLQIFNNSELGKVRSIIDENNEAWFCLKDVADILEISNPRDLPKRIEPEDVDSIYIGVKTGVRKDGSDAIQNVKTNFVNESGLYQVIFMSKKPEAKKFKKWITSEVLPSIRKTGKYSVGDEREIYEWRNNRLQLKKTRRKLTDEIKKFQEYVQSQWDSDGKWYYVLITKVVNKSLFRVDSLKKIKKNLRDEVDLSQMMHIKTLEDMLSNNLVLLIEDKQPPKEIYSKLKDICFKYAELLHAKEKPAYITMDEYMVCLAKKDKHLVSGHLDRKEIVQKKDNQLDLFS